MSLAIPQPRNTMRAAILQGARHFTVEEMPIPTPEPDELLVKTKACGICTSELDMWLGKATGLSFPRFIGHEPAGVVEAVGSEVADFAVGDRVSVWSEGKAYAEHFVTKAAYAAKISPAIPFEQALGEPIACATNGVRKADPQFGDTVALVGTGFMALIMLQVFRARGVGRIIAIDTRQRVLSLALQLGATDIVNAMTTDAVEAVKELTGGKGVDIGVECAGSQQTLDLTGNIVRMEGKLEVFGFHQGEPRTVPWGYWNWMAFQIVNGHVRSASAYVEGMRQGLGLLERTQLKMERLVTHHFALDEINRGFETAAAKEEDFIKGVIVF